MDLNVMRDLNKIAARGLKPDLTLLLDCPVEIGLSRIAKRLEKGTAHQDRFETEAAEFHERVRAGYLEIARAEPERFRIVDASRSMVEVANDIKNLINRELA
jgi:dTMP kinase